MRILKKSGTQGNLRGADVLITKGVCLILAKEILFQYYFLAPHTKAHLNNTF